MVSHFPNSSNDQKLPPSPYRAGLLRLLWVTLNTQLPPRSPLLFGPDHSLCRCSFPAYSGLSFSRTLFGTHERNVEKLTDHSALRLGVQEHSDFSLGNPTTSTSRESFTLGHAKTLSLLFEPPTVHECLLQSWRSRLQEAACGLPVFGTGTKSNWILSECQGVSN